jgi:HAD superfamily hydrolase (TIGR01509 family)
MRAVVFDFDGVIADSEPRHYQALRDSLVPEGIAIDQEEYVRSYLAYDDRGAIRIALELHGYPYDAERVNRIAARKTALFEDLMRRVPFFPGVPELVRSLACEMPLAIASGARREEIETILDSGGLRSCFAAIVGADDVAQAKPHPEPYRSAVDRLRPLAPGLLPKDCVAFEDSMAGIASARSAGLTVVAVTHSYEAAKLGAAHRVIDSFAGLDAAGVRALVAG